MSAPADWIAVDWGTSNLRAWAMQDAGGVIASAESGRGMAGLEQSDYEPALLEVVDQWLRPNHSTAVVACGMVGSRQGWADAGYAQAPCPPRAADPFTKPQTNDARLNIRILNGVSQAIPADVMRGEETQIAGLLAAEPGFDGVACLPGTHTKWVHLSANEIVSFSSFMTGELFGLLSKRSVLRHSVAGGGWDSESFGEAVLESMAAPAKIAAGLFSLRAETLLNDLPHERARPRLSGMLIGAELAGSKPYWLGRDVVIVGAAQLAGAYSAALATCGVTSRMRDATECTLAGLTAAYASLPLQKD